MTKRVFWFVLLLLTIVFAATWLGARVLFRPFAIDRDGDVTERVADTSLDAPDLARGQVEPPVTQVSLEADTNGRASGQFTGRSSVEEGPHAFEEVRATAAELAREGKLDEAMRVLQSIVDTAGPGFDKASASRMLGTYAIRRGEQDAAVQWLESAVDEYLRLPDGDFLAVSTLNLLATLYLGKDNERALDLFRTAIAGSTKGAPESDAIAAMGGFASALQLLGRPQEEAAAIRQLMGRFPDYGKGDNGARAIRVLRLAELEHPSGSDGRLAAIEALGDESWLQRHQVQYVVFEANVRELIRREQYSEAVSMAVRSTRDVSLNPEGVLSDSAEQLLNVIIDYPALSDEEQVTRALRTIARSSSFPDRRQAALDRLARSK